MIEIIKRGDLDKVLKDISDLSKMYEDNLLYYEYVLYSGEERTFLVMFSVYELRDKGKVI